MKTGGLPKGNVFRHVLSFSQLGRKLELLSMFSTGRTQRIVKNPELAQEYEEKLEELVERGACRLIIQVLTTVAQENIDCASDIVYVLEKRVRKVCKGIEISI